MNACVYLCNQVSKMSSYMICKAEIVTSIILIPLWLKLLHPWNRGIHGYIRSHVKGYSSIALFFCCSHLSLVHHLLRKKDIRITIHPKDLVIWFCKWDFQWIASIRSKNIDWPLNGYKLWIQTLHSHFHSSTWSQSNMELIKLVLQAEMSNKPIFGPMYSQP